MELKWLIDYTALVKQGSFSKAAESRFVTQPAFSRRIRALENWLGVSLVDRDKYPTTLTKAGHAFAEQAQMLINQTYAVRSQLQGISAPRKQIQIISQHALAVAFFPDWMSLLEPNLKDILIKVKADNLHDAVDTFLTGNSDFLLSYASDEVFNQLNADDIESLNIGIDQLVPVSAVNDKGDAIFGSDLSNKIPLLCHPQESFFGRIIQQQCTATLDADIKLYPVCENALSEALKALVLKKQGMAWIPLSLIQTEIEQQRLKILTAPFTSVDLNIKLYRLRGTTSDVISTFWQNLIEKQTESAT